MRPKQKLTQLLDLEEKEALFLNIDQLEEYLCITNNFYKHQQNKLISLAKGISVYAQHCKDNNLTDEYEHQLKRAKNVNDMSLIYGDMAKWK